MARPTVLPRIAVAPLLALCQCSLLFNLSGLDDGGLLSGVDATDDVANIDPPGDPGSSDAGSDLQTQVDGLDAPANGEGDPTGFDASSDEEADSTGVEGAPDGRGRETGSVDAAGEGGSGNGGIDSSADSWPDVQGTDGPAESGGIAAGLTTFYPFAETSGTISTDASGNNRPATMQGATFAAGVRDNAAAMNGSAQYVALPPDIVSGLTAFSICTWVNLTTTLVHSHIFDFSTGPSVYMFLTPHSGGNMTQFAITTTGLSGEQALNAPPLGTAGWQHVCVTLIGTTGTLYVNGMQAAQNASMTLNPASLGATTQNSLGRSQFAADPYLNGKVDEFRIYNRALSASEVQQLFQQQL